MQGIFDYAQAREGKLAAGAAPGPHGEQEEKPPPARSQAQAGKLAAGAACGQEGKGVSYLIV